MDTFFEVFVQVFFFHLLLGMFKRCLLFKYEIFLNFIYSVVYLFVVLTIFVDKNETLIVMHIALWNWIFCCQKWWKGGNFIRFYKNGSIFQTSSLRIVLFLSFKEIFTLTNHDIHIFEEILYPSIFILCYNSSEIHFIDIIIYIPESPQQ